MALCLLQSSGAQERCLMKVFKEMSGSLSRARTYNTCERGIA